MSGLRVLVIHNRYRSASPSGENKVVDSDIERLRADGADVMSYFQDSDDIDSWGPAQKSRLLIRPFYSREDVRAVRSVIRSFKPHIAHLHNPYPLISPWVVRVAKQEGVKVVQTIHNYRRSCLNGIHFREGQPCTECVGKRLPWPSIVHGCYQESRAATVPMAAAQVLHRGTWDEVDLYLAVGEGVRSLLIDAGTPADRVLLRPNEIQDPGLPSPLGHGVLFVGRLSAEKGVELLLRSWSDENLGRFSTLAIAGEGQLTPSVREAARVDRTITPLGYLTADALSRAYESCELVVVPSLCFEAHPLSIEAALAHGRAIVAVDSEVTRRYVTEQIGWLAQPEPGSFANAIENALRNRDRLEINGRSARADFVARQFAAPARLADIYLKLLASGIR